MTEREKRAKLQMEEVRRDLTDSLENLNRTVRQENAEIREELAKLRDSVQQDRAQDLEDRDRFQVERASQLNVRLRNMEQRLQHPSSTPDRDLSPDDFQPDYSESPPLGYSRFQDYIEAAEAHQRAILPTQQASTASATIRTAAVAGVQRGRDSNDNCPTLESVTRALNEPSITVEPVCETAALQSLQFDYISTYELTSDSQPEE